MDLWNTGTTGKGSVDFEFAFEEGGINGYVFEFDGDVIAGMDVDPLCVMSLMKQLGLQALSDGSTLSSSGRKTCLPC